MQNKQKSICLFLAVATMLGLVSCGNTPTSSTSEASNASSESSVASSSSSEKTGPDYGNDAMENFLAKAAYIDNYQIDVTNGAQVIEHFSSKADYATYSGYAKTENSDGGYLINGTQGLYKFTLTEDSQIVLGEIQTANPEADLSWFSKTAASLVDDPGYWEADIDRPLHWYTSDETIMTNMAIAMNSEGTEIYADEITLDFDAVVPNKATFTLPLNFDQEDGSVYTVNETIVIDHFGEVHNETIESYVANPTEIGEFVMTDEQKSQMLYAGGEMFPTDVFSYAVAPRYWTQYDEFQIWDLMSGDTTDYWHDYLIADGWIEDTDSANDEFDGGYRYRSYYKTFLEGGKLRKAYTCSTRWLSDEYLANVYGETYGDVYFNGQMMWDVYVENYYNVDEVNEMITPYSYKAISLETEPEIIYVQDLTEYFRTQGNDTKVFYSIVFTFANATEAQAAADAYDALYRADEDWEDDSYNKVGYSYARRFADLDQDNRVQIVVDDAQVAIGFLVYNWKYYTIDSLCDTWRQMAYEDCGLALPEFNFTSSVKSMEVNDFTYYTQLEWGKDYLCYMYASFYVDSDATALRLAKGYEKVLREAGFVDVPWNDKIYSLDDEDNPLVELYMKSEDGQYTLEVGIQTSHYNYKMFSIFFNIYRSDLVHPGY